MLALSTASFMALVGQIVLGMVTVQSDLDPVVATAHLGVASAVFGLVLANTAAVHYVRPEREILRTTI